jgi:hypothetical protein
LRPGLNIGWICDPLDRENSAVDEGVLEERFIAELRRLRRDTAR